MVVVDSQWFVMPVMPGSHFISLACGAAITTTIGRGIGVCYQLYHLARGKVCAYKMASFTC